MKQFLGSLIMSGAAGVVVTSALVVAQVPRAAARLRHRTPPTKNSGNQASRRQEPKQSRQSHEAKPAAAREGPGALPGGQSRKPGPAIHAASPPLVRAELIFVGRSASWTWNIFGGSIRMPRRHSRKWPRSLSKRSSKARVDGVTGKVQTSQSRLDGLALLHEALDVGDEKRSDSRAICPLSGRSRETRRIQKQSAVRYLVDAIDRDLYLSDEQRLKLTESLSSHWDQSWSTSPGVSPVRQPVLPGGYRSLCDAVPGRDAEEDMARGPESGRIGRIRSVCCGGFMNDNDALEVELGEVRKAEPAKHGRAAESNPESPIAECRDQRAVAKEATPKSR